MLIIMHFLIAGGTGLIGSRIVELLELHGDSIVVLTRGQPGERDGTVYMHWDPYSQVQEAVVEAVASSDCVINLSGEPITPSRMGAAKKKMILESRIASTKAIVSAIEASPTKPKSFINGSAVGFYGDRGEEELTEMSGPGSGFLSEVCKAWEDEAYKASEDVPTYTVRTGMVLSEKGGSIPVMARQVLRGFSVKAGSGKQWMPWIHIDDIAGLIITIAKGAAKPGPFNGVAPNSIRNSEFAERLQSALGKNKCISIPAPILNLALGEAARMLLFQSQHAIPARALEIGYKYSFPEIGPALEDVSQKLMRLFNGK
ncbi:MAG: TIGR01777 family oxidoreductase [Candidatus Micrarchaeaceae archaeon]